MSDSVDETQGNSMMVSSAPLIPAESAHASENARADALPTISLHGVRLHAVTESQAITHILNAMDAGRGGVVVTPNLDHIRRCRRDLSFLAIVDEADLVVADGMPLVWASRLQGTPLPGRVAGSDLISTLSAAAAKRGRSIFLLGGDPGTADAASNVLIQQYPQLKVVGVHCPPVGFETNDDEMEIIISRLAQAQPDIVFVALGSPKQERLIAKLELILPSAWWLGVGVSFSFLTGSVKRAPEFMRKMGLEWLHRLGQEPKRLFKRYIVSGLPFAAQLLGAAAATGLARRLGHVPGDNSEGRRSFSTRAPKVQVSDLTVKSADGLAAALPAPPLIIATRSISPLSLRRLKGLILLAGSMRPNPLTTVVGRNVLDLPVDASGSVLNQWLLQAADVAVAAGLDQLPLRVLLARNSMEPRSASNQFAGAFSIERDLSEYRGTGGVLCTLASQYEDDDLILVGNAAQVLLDPLAELATQLARLGGIVNLVAHHDGTSSGMMLLSGRALRLIPRGGYVDMKEQALPVIAAAHDVRVMHTRRPTGLHIRSLSDYIQCLRHVHLARAGRPIVTDPLGEDWRPSFAVAESGAILDASARVHDSVILAGGIVEPGAVLVRSVVCAGGVVRRDRKAVDQIVAAGDTIESSRWRRRRANPVAAASTAAVGVSPGTSI